MIKDCDLAMIRSNISLKETKTTLFSMKSLKAPRPDGYHPIFFKSQWNIIGSYLHRFICDCFQQPNLIHEVNQTLITLIPKCDDPIKVSQFRPIALCNVVYKVVTKIIAQRMRVIMPYVVSDNQSNFIPGRSTVDNILVMQELIHSFKQLKGRKGYMILKLDLENAYDGLEWSFVMDTRQCLGIPSDVQSLIYHCISSASMRVNWNGTVTDSFSFSRGIRQGDPISPYLFVICLERLGHKIKNVVQGGEWIPFSFGRGDSPKLSHMCFTDDLILVAEVSSGQVNCMMNILKAFCDISGQKINLEKSQIFFCQNVAESQIEALSQAIGVQHTKDLGKYLGAPLIH